MITVDDVERELEVSLPQPYRNFLTKNGEGETIWADDPIYGTEWIVYRASELLEKCWGGELYYAKWHKGILSEMPLPTNKMNQANACITIGKDQGGNFLLLDPEKDELFCLCTDPLTLNLITSGGFSEWESFATFEG